MTDTPTHDPLCVSLSRAEWLDRWSPGCDCDLIRWVRNDERDRTAALLREFQVDTERQIEAGVFRYYGAVEPGSVNPFLEERADAYRTAAVVIRRAGRTD